MNSRTKFLLCNFLKFPIFQKYTNKKFEQLFSGLIFGHFYSIRNMYSNHDKANEKANDKACDTVITKPMTQLIT